MHDLKMQSWENIKNAFVFYNLKPIKIFTDVKSHLVILVK